MSGVSPRALIQSLDRQIDANRRELHRRVTIKDRFSCHEAQAAWDSHPDLHERERELFRQRGAAQIERDAQDAERARQAASRECRARMPNKCPTCNGSGHLRGRRS